MKNLTLSLLLVLVALSGFAKNKNKAANATPAPPEGFWVVESNMHTPRQQTVYFYNNHSELVYQEKLQDTKLNIQKKKTKKELNAMLERMLKYYAVKQQASYDQGWFAIALRK